MPDSPSSSDEDIPKKLCATNALVDVKELKKDEPKCNERKIQKSNEKNNGPNTVKSAAKLPKDKDEPTNGKKKEDEVQQCVTKGTTRRRRPVRKLNVKDITPPQGTFTFRPSYCFNHSSGNVNKGDDGDKNTSPDDGDNILHDSGGSEEALQKNDKVKKNEIAPSDGVILSQ